jgi:hypothetical protein
MCVDGGPNFGQVGWSFDRRGRESARFTLRPEPREPEESFVIPQAWLDAEVVPTAPESCEIQCGRCRAGDHECYRGPVAGEVLLRRVHAVLIHGESEFAVGRDRGFRRE